MCVAIFTFIFIYLLEKNADDFFMEGFGIHKLMLKHSPVLCLF